MVSKFLFLQLEIAKVGHVYLHAIQAPRFLHLLKCTDQESTCEYTQTRKSGLGDP
jgi:hypothetical protein